MNQQSPKKLKSKKLVLKFPKHLVDQPVVYHLVKDYNLIVNILKANISPGEEGILVLELSGSDTEYHNGIEFLKKSGIIIEQLGKDIVLDKKKCVNCGACIPLCPVNALEINKETFEIHFNKEKCIACEVCISACPVKAIKLEI